MEVLTLTAVNRMELDSNEKKKKGFQHPKLKDDFGLFHHKQVTFLSKRQQGQLYNTKADTAEFSKVLAMASGLAWVAR